MRISVFMSILHKLLVDLIFMSLRSKKNCLYSINEIYIL